MITEGFVSDICPWRSEFDLAGENCSLCEPYLVFCNDCWGYEHCPVNFGPWGAWRAVGREVSWRAEVISEMAREYDADRLNLGALFVSLGMYIEIRIYLDASGWSP